MSNQVPYLIVSLIEKFSKQLNGPAINIESIILSSSLKIDGKTSEPIVKKLIENLCDYPEFLGECLLIIRSQNLLALLRKDYLSLSDAFEASKIVEILSSRKDFDISFTCLELDSKFSDSIIIINDLDQLVEWASLCSDFKSRFSVKSEMSYISLKMILQKLVFGLLNNKNEDIVRILRALKHFYSYTGIEINFIINLSIEKSITKIQDLELCNNFCEISEILTALIEIDAKYQAELIGRLKKKYGVNPIKVFDARLPGNDGQITIKNLSEINLTSYKQYLNKSQETIAKIYKGTVCNKLCNLVKVLKIENHPTVQISIEELKTNDLINNPLFLRYFGCFVTTENSKEMAYFCYEDLEREKSLEWHVKNKIEFNKIDLVKSLIEVMVEIE